MQMADCHANFLTTVFGNTVTPMLLTLLKIKTEIQIFELLRQKKAKIVLNWS